AGGPRVAVGHVHERPLGPGDDRPDAEAGTVVDEGGDRGAEEGLRALRLLDAGGRRRGIHSADSPIVVPGGIPAPRGGRRGGGAPGHRADRRRGPAAPPGEDRAVGRIGEGLDPGPWSGQGVPQGTCPRVPELDRPVLAAARRPARPAPASYCFFVAPFSDRSAPDKLSADRGNGNTTPASTGVEVAPAGRTSRSCPGTNRVRMSC